MAESEHKKTMSRIESLVAEHITASFVAPAEGVECRDFRERCRGGEHE